MPAEAGGIVRGQQRGRQINRQQEQGRQVGRQRPQTALKLPAVVNELVAEIDSSLSEEQADALARRHGLVRVASQHFRLINATIGLFRVTDGSPIEVARRKFAGAPGVRSAQLNLIHHLQDQKAVATEGDPAQYALAKLRLPQAHTLASGANVTIAVIDSGIDVRHPELLNSIADNFERSAAMAARIPMAPASPARSSHSAADGRAAGPDPGICAFGATPNGAESTTYVILRALDYGALHGAQIINMSFAGPKDPLIERGIGAAAARNIVMIAASGNAGPKSPPLYPAANANVIAVSATDAQDRLFTASNRGGHIAVAAPGVDIFLPAPDEKYQMTSGTLVFRRLCQRPRRADAGAQSSIQAGPGARHPDAGDGARSRQPGPRRPVRRRSGRCLCRRPGCYRRTGDAGGWGFGARRRQDRGTETGSPDAGPEPVRGRNGLG